MRYYLNDKQFLKLWNLNSIQWNKSSFDVKCRKRSWNIKYKEKFNLKYHESSTNFSPIYLEGNEKYITLFLLQL